MRSFKALNEMNGSGSGISYLLPRSGVSPPFSTPPSSSLACITFSVAILLTASWWAIFPRVNGWYLVRRKVFERYLEWRWDFSHGRCYRSLLVWPEAVRYLGTPEPSWPSRHTPVWTHTTLSQPSQHLLSKVFEKSLPRELVLGRGLWILLFPDVFRLAWWDFILATQHTLTVAGRSTVQIHWFWKFKRQRELQIKGRIWEPKSLDDSRKWFVKSKVVKYRCCLHAQLLKEGRSRNVSAMIMTPASSWMNIKVPERKLVSHKLP